MEIASRLGITFSNYKELYHGLNLLAKTKEVFNCLDTLKNTLFISYWKSRINENICASITYIHINSLRHPVNGNYQCNTKIHNIYKTDKINRTPIIHTYETGRLKMIDFFLLNTLKRDWLK